MKWDLYPANRLILCETNLVGDLGVNVIVRASVGCDRQGQGRGRIEIEVDGAQALYLRRPGLKYLNVLGTISPKLVGHPGRRISG